MPGEIRSIRKTSPIQESFPSSTSELPLNPPAFPCCSCSQLAIQPKELCRPECIVCLPPPFYPWVQSLSRASQLIASSALLSDLAEKCHKHEYHAIVQNFNALNIGRFDREVSMYLHFGVAYAHYKLKQYKLARCHLSKCKLVASGAGDTSVCCFYLGKVAISHRKAAKHFRKAALCCRESSLAKMFDLIIPSPSALHRQSAHEFFLANRFPQALEELPQAIETSQSKEECFSAHYDRGKLYQLMANHTMALNDFDLAGLIAEGLGDCVAAKQAYKDACGTCILLKRANDALHFFECSLTCVSVDCKKCFAGAEQRIRDLQWICSVIDRLPIYRAIKLIPRTYFNELKCIQDGISSQFQAILERCSVDCQEEEGLRPSMYSVVVEDYFPVIEPSNAQVSMFVKLAEETPPVLIQLPITGLHHHRSNRTHLLNQPQHFLWEHPDFMNDNLLLRSRVTVS